jgi:hypothetical protein
LCVIPAFGTGWRTKGSTGMTSTNIAKYSESNLNGAKNSQLKPVKLALKELGVPLQGFLRTARKRFQVRKVSLNSKSIKLMAV